MLKELLIIAYLICDYHAVFSRISTLDSFLSSVVFAGLYTFLAAGLLSASLIRHNVLRIIMALLFSAASIFKISFEKTTADTLTYQSFANLYYASGQVDQALLQYRNSLISSSIVGVILFLGIALPPARLKLSSFLASAIPIGAFGVLSTMLYLRGGEGSRGLPPAYAPISFAALMAGEAMAAEHNSRQAVTIPKSSAPASEDIVLIVDESIAANYLDIDHANGVYSGLNKQRSGLRITNFGFASSIYKCSAESNAVLRFGGTPKTYITALAEWPSIWNYARNAGLRSVYIDGQSEQGHLQNFMTNEERYAVDEFIQLDGVPVQDRDMQIASLIAKRVNNGVPEFIYVNKVGAHFPVAAKYPEVRTRFRPVLSRQSAALSSWSSDLRGFNGTPEEWLRYRNSYRNTLEWNVGEFFDRLLNAPAIGKATILYTSDHGQDLHERKNPGINTHCGTAKAAQEEGLVPLVIIDQSHALAPDWKRSIANNYNNTSAFRVFPTLLALMGYDKEILRKSYGRPLDEPSNDNFGYLSDFKPLNGKKSGFRDIDLNEIVSPPITDFDRTTGSVQLGRGS